MDINKEEAKKELKMDHTYMEDLLKLKELGIELIDKTIEFLSYYRKMILKS